MRRSRTDVPWDPGYLELVSPEQVLLLDELGPDAAGPTALSPVAITSPFRFLSDEGIRVMHAVCSELERFAGGNNRIATVRARRRLCHWSTFLPTSSGRSPRHAVNYAPDCDAVSFARRQR
jgi:hypothetical protein